MEKTSRRNFAKTMTAALAAVPAALVTNACAGGQTPSESPKSGPSTQGILNHQDTPPMFEILDGSLIFESQDDLTESSSGSDFFYKSSSTQTIDHIRVIADTGDKMYEDLDASATGKSSIIVVHWINEDKNVEGDVIITGVDNGAGVFQIKSDKKLKKHPNQLKRRKFKWEHEGQGGGSGKRIRIESVAITNSYGRKTTFSATPTGNGNDFVPDEFRILIWRE